MANLYHLSILCFYFFDSLLLFLPTISNVHNHAMHECKNMKIESRYFRVTVLRVPAALALPNPLEGCEEVSNWITYDPSSENKALSPLVRKPHTGLWYISPRVGSYVSGGKGRAASAAEKSKTCLIMIKGVSRK